MLLSACDTPAFFTHQTFLPSRRRDCLPLHRMLLLPQPSQKHLNRLAPHHILASLVKGRWIDGKAQTVALLLSACDTPAFFTHQTFLPSRRRDCSAIPRPLHNNITQLITFLTITPYFNIFSQLTICFIIIIIHRHLNILELINLSNIFQTSKIPLIKNVAIFALLLYNDIKTDLKIKEEYYGKKCTENHCKHRK